MSIQHVRYRGQAQQSEFDPVKVPDEASKITAEANEQIRRMDRNRRQELENRRQYQQALADNNNEQRQNRADNFKLETTFQDAYRKAEEQRERQELKNIETEGKNKQRLWKDLAAFSEGATKLAMAVDEKIGTDAKAYGKYLTHKYGLSADDLKWLDRKNRHIEAYATANNAVIESLRLKGISDQDLNAIRNLSGRTLLGAQIYSVSTMGENIGQHYNNLSSKPITVPGQGEVTLAQIEKGFIGSPDLHKQVFDQLTLQLYKDLEGNEGTAGYSGKFLAEHLSPGIEKEWKRRSAEYRTGSGKIHAQKAESDLQTGTLAAVKSGGSLKSGLNLFNLVDERSGGYSENRTYHWNKIGDHISAAIETGEIREETIDQIENTNLTIPGQGDKRFADFKPEIVGNWRAALRKRAQKEEEQQSITELNYSNERKRGFRAQIVRMGRYATTEEIQILQDQFIERGYEIPKWLEEADKYEEYIDDIGENRIKLLISQGLWTEEEMASGRYSENLLGEYKKQVQNGPSAADKEVVDGQINGIKAAIAKAGQQLAVDPTQRNYEVTALSGVAIARLRTKVSTAIKNNLYASPDEAWIQEGLQLKKDIESGEGDWGLKKLGNSDQIDLKGGFEYFSGPKSIDQTAADMLKAVRDNEDIIYTKEFYNLDDIKATNDLGRTKKVPNWAIQTAGHYKTLDPYDIINEGRRLHGLDPIKVPGYPKVDAKYRAWVNNKPSLNKTVAATSLTSKVHDPKADPYEPIRGHIRTAYARNDEEHDGYDAMDSGSSNAGFGSFGGTTGTASFNKPLVEMPISALQQLQAENRLGGAGAYGITSEVINNYIETGLIKPTDMFDKKIQDRIANQLIFEKTSKFIVSGNGARATIWGLGRAFPGLIGEDEVYDAQERAGGYEALIKSLEVLETLGIEPARLRPDLRIRVKELIDKGGLASAAEYTVKKAKQEAAAKAKAEAEAEVSASEPVTPEITAETPASELQTREERDQLFEKRLQERLGKVNEVLEGTE